MGGEFGQTSEWDFSTERQWPLLQFPFHAGLRCCVAALNRLLGSVPALKEQQFSAAGFRWLGLSHCEESVVAYQRIGQKGRFVRIILNMTTVGRTNWTPDIQGKLKWKVVLSNRIDRKQKQVQLTITSPPLAGLVLA